MNAFYELPGRHQYISGHFVRNNLQLSPRFYFVGVPLEWNKFLVISKRKKSRKKSLILTAFFFPAFTYFLLFYFPLFFFFCALALKPWIRPMNKTRFFFINIDKEMESRVHTFLNVKQSVLNIDKRVLRKKEKENVQWSQGKGKQRNGNNSILHGGLPMEEHFANHASCLIDSFPSFDLASFSSCCVTPNHYTYDTAQLDALLCLASHPA